MLLGCVVSAAHAQVDAKLMQGLKWREIGPFRGGRSNACSGVVGRPTEFYMGTTGGGLYKSTDTGVTWKNVSDGFFKTGSVGAIAVSISSPDVVYVGMGEHAIRGNISPGDGVYKSTDAGKTWRSMGLAATQNISKIVVHPKDPQKVWVAALGPVYGPSQERGIFKSEDGGISWRKTLYVDDRSGAIDLVEDEKNPQVFYAATWTAWRTPFSLNSGGPGSKLWKSTDGGETWQDLSRSPGLPEGVLGKICVAVSPVDSNLIFAMVEAKQGGLYRSDDAGATWKLVNSTNDIRQRPWYFSRVFADPMDKETVYVGNVMMHRSTDGGKTFRSFVAQHVDNHDFWIDPADNKRLVCANDGGVSVSVDQGRTWSEQDFATAQFYHVSADNAFPYRVLGAQQDNSTVRIPSRTFTRGIGFTDWTSTAGGESGYVVAKPTDPNLVFGGSYGGTLDWLNHATNQRRSIDPWPNQPLGAGVIEQAYRLNWTFPIVFSPHDPNTMYVGSQYLLVSRDDGGSFTRMSPDLTTNDVSKQQSSGGPITQDNTSVEYYCTIFTIAESPKRRGLIWVGSDDGLVHLTQDGGRTWSQVTPAQMPKWGLCSMIEASPFEPGTAYLAMDNHEQNDWRPYIYITRDFGRSWTLATRGIPSNHYVRVVREDPTTPGLLYAGTEFGIFVSFDRGENWQPMQGNLPIVPIHDLVIKDQDLVVGTHGRSFWIYDDLSAIRQMSKASATEPHLFTPAPGIPISYANPIAGTDNLGQNPEFGNIIVQYYLPADSSVKFELRDQAGAVVASNTAASGKAGLNRLSLRPSYPSWRGFPGLVLWGGGAGSIKAPPGTYELSMTVGDQVRTVRAVWAKDPRVTATDADLVEQWRFSLQIARRTDEANRAVEKIRELRTKLEKVQTPDAQRIVAELTKVEEVLHQTRARATQDLLNFPVRLNNKLSSLLGSVQTGWNRPTRQAYEVFRVLEKELQGCLEQLEKLSKEAQAVGTEAQVSVWLPAWALR